MYACMHAYPGVEPGPRYSEIELRVRLTGVEAMAFLSPAGEVTDPFIMHGVCTSVVVVFRF